MIKAAIVGIGNAGNQVAELGFKAYGIPGIALNSSQQDICNVYDIPGLVIGDEKGAGKDRNIAKEFMKAKIRDVLGTKDFSVLIATNEVFFIVSSSGGGTGSGMAPVFADVLTKLYPAKRFIPVGIAPPLKESAAAQQNSLDYMKELRGFRPTYMMYDNETRTRKSTDQMMLDVNRNIVDDIIAIAGIYNTPTPYNSIDEKDTMKIAETPDRLVVVSIEGMNEKDVDEKSIEDRLIEALRQNTHAEIDHDQIIKRMGIITNLNPKLHSTFDTNLPKFREIVGEPVETFEHIYINKDEGETNRVIIIMSGLSVPDDRLKKTVQRRDEALSLSTKTKESSVLDGVDGGIVDDLRKTDKGESITLDGLDDVMSKYFN